MLIAAIIVIVLAAIVGGIALARAASMKTPDIPVKPKPHPRPKPGSWAEIGVVPDVADVYDVPNPRVAVASYPAGIAPIVVQPPQGKGVSPTGQEEVLHGGSAAIERRYILARTIGGKPFRPYGGVTYQLGQEDDGERGEVVVAPGADASKVYGIPGAIQGKVIVDTRGGRAPKSGRLDIGVLCLEDIPAGESRSYGIEFTVDSAKVMTNVRAVERNKGLIETGRSIPALVPVFANTDPVGTVRDVVTFVGPVKAYRS